MHCITYPRQVKLVAGIITSSDEASLLAEKFLQKAFGPIDYKSQKIKFNFTDYYEKDMGPGLIRLFFSFKKPVGPNRLPLIKLSAIKIEKKIAKKIRAVKRPVNIDPGYITDAKLILATTKDYRHRIYIDKGIYAEMTLYYKDQTFRPWEWTYPDYKTDDYIRVFNKIRQNLMQEREK